MTLDRYFKLSSYTFFGSSFLMLVATRQLDLLAIVLFSLVLVLSWHIDAGRLKWQLSGNVVNWLMILFLPFPFIDWIVLGTAPIIALIHFIFFAAGMKLIQVKRNRDWLWLYVVAFFQMLLAAGMMIDTTFFVLLLLFLFSAVSTLVSFEMRRAQENVDNAAVIEVEQNSEYWRETENIRTALRPPRWRTIAIFSGISLLTIIILATPLFLAMPRLALRNSGAGWMQGAALSGFSETVHLGDVGQLKLNPKLVMRVRVVQPPDQYRAALRWRGVTLDFYDGNSWRDSTTLRRGSRAEARPVTKHQNVFWIDDGAEVNHGAIAPFLTRQSFYLEPLGTPTVFAAPRALWLEGLPSLWMDSSDGMWTSNHPMNRVVYHVESDTRQPTDRDLRDVTLEGLDARLKQRYTQLPPALDSRIGTLAGTLTQKSVAVIDTVRLIENHLRTSYGYSLNLQRTDEGDPVADFLFNVKSGHCEYFATSMVLMLRTQGIPARLVNGFQMGEYSDVSDFYTVRQSDAHSWVEVYFPKFGWVAFDPTPSAGISQYENGWMATVRHYADAMEMFWLEKVIGFSSSEQAALALRAQRMFSTYQQDSSTWWAHWKERLSQWFKTLYRPDGSQGIDWARVLRAIFLHPILLGLYGLGLLAIGIVVWRQYAFSWQRRSTQDSIGSAIAFYQEMLNVLRRAGYERSPDQTPQEFALSLPFDAVTEITSLYHRARFGSAPLTAAEIQRIESLLAELRSLPK